MNRKLKRAVVMKFCLRILFFAIVFIGCAGSSQKKSSIVGKWKSYKTEFRNGIDTTFLGKKMAWNSKWEFTEDGYFIDYDLGDEGKFPFTLRDNYIHFGLKPVYIIEKLSDKELVVIEVNRSEMESDTDTRQYFKKVKSFDEKVEGP